MLSLFQRAPLRPLTRFCQRLAIACLGLAALSGCARNAVLEVELDLPPGPTDRFAVVQFETADGFDSTWLAQYPGTPLGSGRQTVEYSLITESPNERLRVKVNFCTTPDCTGLDDTFDRAPAVWYELERSFYIGERTRWVVTIDTLPIDPPSAPMSVGRCQIQGCIEATGTTTTFCRLDGTHYCE